MKSLKLKRKEVSICSDMHIGHDRDFIWKARGYSSPEEHHEDMLYWLSYAIGTSTTCISLGDLTFKADVAMRKLIWPNIYNDSFKAILGNHDAKFIEKCSLGDRNLGDAAMLKLDTNEVVVISHYPMLEWPSAYHGAYHLHGHCHNNLAPETYRARRMDCSTDCLIRIFGRPVADLDELLEYIDIRDVEHAEREPIISD